MKNLPSSVFKAQVDPKSMLWKDCLVLKSEHRKETDIKRGFEPRARPQESDVGCMIQFQEALGVTLPKEDKDGGGISPKDILKRSLRIAVQKKTGHKHWEMVANAIQVPA